MLLCNPHVIGPVRHLIHHGFQGRAGGHGGGDSDDFLIDPGQFQDGVPKNILVKRCFRFVRDFFDDLTGKPVEFTRRMVGGLVLFGFGESFPLLGNDVQKLGAGDFLHVSQYLSQMEHIVPVHRPK
jgi:hypothetical protein